MTKVVISVENLSKQYRLGYIGTGTLSHDINRAWARIRGKEDPYTMVGDLNDRTKAGGSEYVWALKDINFDVREGEVIGIIGKNGAGKSTLLKILSQITTPTRGTVKLKGRVASLLEVGTGFHPELTGLENIYLNGAILGMRKHEIKSKLDEIISFAGTEKYIDTPVKRYSSGMKVRLGFAVAAHLDPEILIVDEVLAVGDAEFQDKCLGKMGDISKNSGRTILFVSHNLSAVNSLCPKSVLIENGQVRGFGQSEQIIEQYLSSSTAESVTSLRKKNTKTKRAEILIAEFPERQDNVFKVDEEVVINMVAALNSPVSYTLCTLMVYDPKGNLLFHSTNEEKADSTIHKTSTGLVRLQVTLPKLLLKPGRYIVHLSLFEKGTGALDKIAPALSFEIIDNHTKRGIKGMYRRDPVIAPLLPWKEEEISLTTGEAYNLQGLVT